MKHEIIEKISQIIGSALREADVVHLFTLSRKLLESVPKNDLQRFSLLRLYCDWMLHTGIDRSEAGALLLAEVHNIVADHLQKKDNSAFGSEVTDALSLSTLRHQMNGLFKSFDSPLEIDEINWRKIVPIVAEIISHCPLEIDPSKPKLKPIVETIQQRPLKGTSVIEQLMIIKVSNVVFNPSAPANEYTYCISLKMTDTTSIIAPLVYA